MITIKNESQIEKMRRAGALLHSVLDALRQEIHPGITTLHLDHMAETIRAAGAIPSFKGYEGFPYSICASVDDQVVHGFATNDKLRQGQLLSIDCGVIWMAGSLTALFLCWWAVVKGSTKAGRCDGGMLLDWRQYGARRQSFGRHFSCNSDARGSSWLWRDTRSLRSWHRPGNA